MKYYQERDGLQQEERESKEERFRDCYLEEEELAVPIQLHQSEVKFDTSSEISNKFLSFADGTSFKDFKYFWDKAATREKERELNEQQSHIQEK